MIARFVLCRLLRTVSHKKQTPSKWRSDTQFQRTADLCFKYYRTIILLYKLFLDTDTRNSWFLTCWAVLVATMIGPWITINNTAGKCLRTRQTIRWTVLIATKEYNMNIVIEILSWGGRCLETIPRATFTRRLRLIFKYDFWNLWEISDRNT